MIQCVWIFEPERSSKIHMLNKQTKQNKKHQTNWTLYLLFLPKDSLFLFLYYPSIFIHYYDNDNGHPIGWTFKYDNDNNNMKYMQINGNVWTKKTKLPCTYLINARKKNCQLIHQQQMMIENKWWTNKTQKIWTKNDFWIGPWCVFVCL